MSAKTEAIISDLLNSIENVSKEKTTFYDAQATVLRIEEDTAWVHFEGGAIETPAKLTIGAKVGDTVMVRVSGGNAYLLGNATAPPTDDTMAKGATLTANYAVSQAIRATDAADIAQRSAEVATQAAETAIAEAEVAHEAAEAAQISADEAKESARNATNSANNALTQLSTVEEVVDTLNWIKEHGDYELTTDTEAVSGKTYYERVGEAEPYSYAVVTAPASNPSQAGYYELVGVDESISHYVRTHLAVTDEGLFILMDNTGSTEDGYKLKLNTTGAYIINNEGAEVAKYSTTTVIGEATGAHAEFSKDRLSFIDKKGSEVAYIAVDENGESTFYMTRAVVVQDLYFGYWQWQARSNNNLALKWVGA